MLTVSTGLQTFDTCQESHQGNDVGANDVGMLMQEIK